MTQLKHPIISLGLVTLQFTLIAVLFWLLPINLHPAVITLQILAIATGLWAVKVMHLGQFNIVPDPKSDTQLVTKGPYKWIRHPMYFSIILIFFPAVIMDSTILSLAVYIVLLGTLIIKLSYEEHLLASQLPDYQAYQQNSKKLIPFVF